MLVIRKCIRFIFFITCFWKVGSCTRHTIEYEITDIIFSISNKIFHYRIEDQQLLKHGSGCVWKKNVSFNEKITSIALKAGPFTDPKVLFASKDFSVMYRYPRSYLSHTYAFLANHTNLLEHKAIVLYAMEQLPFSDYLALASHCVHLYNEAQIPDHLLITALGYTLAGDHPIVQNHKAPAVQKLLAQILHPTPKLIQHVSLILNGFLLKDWNKKQIFSHFKWEKRPLPFHDTVKQIVQDSFIGWSASTEGLLRSDAFMMLYEHPDYYIKTVDFVHLWLEQPNIFLEVDETTKYHPLWIYHDVMINTMRKLDEHQFLDLVMALYQAHHAKYRYLALLLSCWSEYNIVYNQYDTLSLKPFPISTNLNQYLHLPHTMQRDFSYYIKECLPEIIYQQKLYGIATYNQEKPFYCFD